VGGFQAAYVNVIARRSGTTTKQSPGSIKTKLAGEQETLAPNASAGVASLLSVARNDIFVAKIQ
jgi:hypothetical protein